MTIDLRSDTVTRPTREMLAAMVSADTGDDVYGEDPAVLALEERVADLLGHEAALFTVSGSLANGLAVRSLVPTGQEMLCEALAHVVRAELGSHAAVYGVTTRTWAHPRGHIDLEVIRRMMMPDAGPYLVSTRAIVVENTHNFAGGTIQPLADLRALRKLVDETGRDAVSGGGRGAAGVQLHLDGARLWNAHVASGVPLRVYGQLFDTVSVCLSKGLGAPVGSVLAGGAGLIEEARVWRKRLGAGWRQAGVLAAAGLYAIENHIERLAEDHENAAMIARIIADADPSVLDTERVETNVVLLDVGDRAAWLVARSRDEGVLSSIVAPGIVRLMTHLDLSAADARRAAEIVATLLES